MGRVVLDSSVLIAVFYEGDKHYKSATSRLSGGDNEYFISAITFAEALTHAYKRGDGDFMKVQILKSVEGVIEVSEEIAARAAEVRAQTNLRLPDSLISATASYTAAELWTFDATLAKVHVGAVFLD